MARMARVKLQGAEGWYHVHCRVAGRKDDYVLSKPVCRQKLIGLLQFYSEAYCCELASFTIMGTHWHGILHFEEPRELTREELNRYAHRFYRSPESRERLKKWTDAQWERFAKRLFDVSEFMRNVQSAFATWYNQVHQRRGRFWADRYKSVCLGSLQAVEDCMLYVDLNPVRAGLVQRPEQWKGSSLYYREIDQAHWLMRLKTLYGYRQESKALREYRQRLYYRGNVPTKRGQAKITDAILEQEKARGFSVTGMYRRRLRYFADGLAIGSETFLRERLADLRNKGYYTRRQHPIAQPEGLHLTLREQRKQIAPT